MQKIELLLLSIVSLFMASCDADTFLDQKPTNSKEMVSFQTTWQNQLEYAKNNNNVITRSSSNKIYFIGHIYNGKINTESQKSELLDQLFADDADIVMYLDTLNFEIIPLKEVREKAKSMAIDDPSETLKIQLDSVIKVGMDIIELEWLYKGKTYYSTAIASNEQGGILYDHIGHMIIVPDRHKSQTKMIKSDVKALKTRSEGSGITERSFVLQDDGGYNVFGDLVWEYTISCSSFFDENGVLYSRSMTAPHRSVIGWSCDAQVKTVSGDIGASNFHEFAWGHVHARLMSVSLEWNGVGFKILGGGTGSTGSVVHRR